MHTDDLQFGPGSSTKIIHWMQKTYPAYEKFAASRSFFYRALDHHKKRLETPNLEPHRDKRGENRKKTKRENPDIVQLCDELLSEDKTTAPTVQAGLHRNGFTVSLSTIYRIARDLTYRWQKPWHTDILTLAQKLKRKIFCAGLLRLPDAVLFRKIAEWMFTDEKWWDIIGPACYKYVKTKTGFEAKMQNQVCVCFCLFLLVLFFVNTHWSFLMSHCVCLFVSLFSGCSKQK